jgi:hypothetical protein
VFPVAVLGVALLVAAWAWTDARPSAPPGSSGSAAPPGPLPRHATASFVAAVTVWVVLAGPVLHLPRPAVAPPLFVATLE